MPLTFIFPNSIQGQVESAQKGEKRKKERREGPAVSLYDKVKHTFWLYGRFHCKSEIEWL